MEPLKQRLEDVEAVIRQLDETVAGLEQAREFFLREPGLSGAMLPRAVPPRAVISLDRSDVARPH